MPLLRGCAPLAHAMAHPQTGSAPSQAPTTASSFSPTAAAQCRDPVPAAGEPAGAPVPGATACPPCQVTCHDPLGAREARTQVPGMRANETPTAGRTAAAEEIEPLTVDTRGLAQLLGIPYSTVSKLCAAKAWQYDELPPPVYLGRGSARGDGSGTRRWVIAHVQRWLDERARAVA